MGHRIIMIGIIVMVAGTVGIISFAIFFLPSEAGLGSQASACIFSTCISSHLHRIFSGASVLLTLFGISLVLLGGRLGEVERRDQAEDATR